MHMTAAYTALGLLATIQNPTPIQNPGRADGRPVMGIGIGAKSCEYWLSEQKHTNEGKVWIFGFWSGLNAGFAVFTENTETEVGIVGLSVGNEEILEAVTKICTDNPKLSLSSATVLAYHNFQKDGK